MMLSLVVKKGKEKKYFRRLWRPFITSFSKNALNIYQCCVYIQKNYDYKLQKTKKNNPMHNIGFTYFL